MKQIIRWLFICICAVQAANGQPVIPASATPTNSVATTNQVIVITNTQTFEYSGVTGIAIWRGDVFVDDPQMTISCDILTVHFVNTNAPPAGAKGTPKVAETKPAAPGKTNADVGIGFGGKIESIIAEGQGRRVVLVQKKDNSEATGQKAVYTAENDTVVLTGEPMMETPQKGKIWAPIINFDRTHSVLTTQGPTRIVFNSSSMGKTNANSTAKSPKTVAPAVTPGK